MMKQVHCVRLWGLAIEDLQIMKYFSHKHKLQQFDMLL